MQEVASTYSIRKPVSPNLVQLCLKFSVLVTLLFLVIDGALLQIENALFGGLIPVPGSYLRILLALIFLVIVLFSSGKLRRNSLSFVFLVLLGYIAIDWIYLTQFYTADSTDVLYGYWTNFSPLLLLYLAAMIKPVLTTKGLVRSLVFVFLIVGVIGLMQFATEQPLLPTASSDGNLQITQYEEAYGTGVRAFSLCSNSLSLGIVSTFMAAACFGWQVRGLKRLFPLLLFAFAAAVCIATRNRTTYLMFGWAIASVFLFRSKLPRLFGIWLPALGIIAGGFALIEAYFIGSVRASGAGSSSSLFERFREWRYYAGSLRSMGTTLFGMNVFQGKKAMETTALPIDNVFLQITLQSGVLGLLCFIAIYIAIWRLLYRAAKSEMTPLTLGAIGVWSALPVGGLTNLVLTPCASCCLLMFCCKQLHNPAERTDSQKASSS